MDESFYLAEQDLGSFVGKLIEKGRVIGPVARKNTFVFHELSSPRELRLDYDVTILPAKKAFFPPHQPLVTFTETSMESCIAPVEQVLFGVHFHEVKAIDMLDQLFRSGHEDRNYLANRELTTIVASSIQKIHPRAFFASVGTGILPVGHDAFLTRITGGYHYEVRTEKGRRLLDHGNFRLARPEELEEALRVNAEVLKKCPEELPGTSDEIARKVRSSFGNKELWMELSRDCFSCGTCNIVCPTCYCFDVQDHWNLDQKSGVRERVWDGCLLEDFAQVSLGAGAHENFREHQSSRFRHRMMRKMAYLNPKLGGPACVGCGRCSAGCVPDIADPVAIVKKIMAT